MREFLVSYYEFPHKENVQMNDRQRLLKEATIFQDFTSDDRYFAPGRIANLPCKESILLKN
jgi:hypothetical protein